MIYTNISLESSWTFVIKIFYLFVKIVYFKFHCPLILYTRNVAKFHPPNVRTHISYQSITYQSPLIWNSIHTKIRNSKTLNLFKNKFRGLLIEKCSSSYELIIIYFNHVIILDAKFDYFDLNIYWLYFDIYLVRAFLLAR